MRVIADIPEPEALNRILTVYAKDPTLRFRSHRTSRRSLTTPAIRRAALEWAMPAYNELRARY